MSFTEEQLSLLVAPLLRENVKGRTQSGRTLSYLEGWHVIAEANRIFGFGGWTRETVDIRPVSEHERKIGQQQKPGWGVSYIAKVRITVEGVLREGIGAGHGIDVDLGLAHESAIKEAETDGMKRALMTFGNQFGLALYDKTQANVVDEEAAPTMSELLEIADKNLRRTALNGTKALSEAWMQVAPELKPALKVALDKHIKPIAQKQDDIASARSA